MNNLKVGDVVQLKSGGPLMTIHSIGSYNGTTKAHCQWFDESKVSEGTFPLESLVLDSDD